MPTCVHSCRGHSCGTTISGACCKWADDRSLTTYEDVVADYRRSWLSGVQEEAEWFGKQPKSLIDAIIRACDSKIRCGTCGSLLLHSHQRRPFSRWREAPSRAAEVLLGEKGRIEACHDFAALHHLVEQLLNEVPGIGELAVYDIAHRISLFCGYEPVEVMLHRGTRDGARGLGVDINRRSIPMKCLPSGLRSLSAAQLEDVLCIYKKALARISASMRGASKPGYPAS